MKAEQKIKQQAEKIQEMATHLGQAQHIMVHLTSMLDQTTQALKYIASKGQNMKQEAKIILLKKVGLPDPGEAPVVQPEIVATECMQILQSMQKEHMEKMGDLYVESQTGKKAKPRDEIEHVHLKDGDEIVFTTEFDALFHKCCQCGLVHEVRLARWHLDRDEHGDVVRGYLKTKWYRRGSLPEATDLIAKGHKVIKREELS